jgi:hypothetical protein
MADETRADDTRILTRAVFERKLRECLRNDRGDATNCCVQIGKHDAALRELLAAKDALLELVDRQLNEAGGTLDTKLQQQIVHDLQGDLRQGASNALTYWRDELAAKDEEIRRLKQERFTAENHRVGLMTILGVQGGTFADAVAVIEAKDDDIQRLKSVVDADSTEMERLRGCALQAERERDAGQADNRRLREALGHVAPHLKHREDRNEICYDWCPRCRAADALLATVPASLQPSPVHDPDEATGCADDALPSAVVDAVRKHLQPPPVQSGATTNKP